MAFDFSTVNFLPNKSGGNFNFLQQIDIRTYMELAYLNSALAKKMFDDWGKPINVEFNNEGVFAVEPVGWAMPTDHYRSNPINFKVLSFAEIYYLWHAIRSKVDLIFYGV
jgi:hypothetical protein